MLNFWWPWRTACLIVLTGFSVRSKRKAAQHESNQHQHANPREEQGFVEEGSVEYSLVRIRIHVLSRICINIRIIVC